MSDIDEIRKRHEAYALPDISDIPLEYQLVFIAADTIHQDRGWLLDIVTKNATTEAELRTRIAELERALDAALDQCRQHSEAYERLIAELEHSIANLTLHLGVSRDLARALYRQGGG